MTIQLDIQLATTRGCPSQRELRKWIKAAIGNERDNVTIGVRIVDEPEMTELNHTYRNKNKPTNVLSFPCTLPLEIRGDLLGDLVICAPVIEQEAKDQDKPLNSHWAHMLVHGTLHLLGYDHEEEAMAQEMEAHEIAILLDLGFANPYGVRQSND